MTQPAPGPYATLEIGAHTASSGCHVYLIDKNGRKIGVVWGKAQEKHYTAAVLATSHDLLTAALAVCDWIAKASNDTDYLNGDSDKNPGDAWEDLEKIEAQLNAALDKAGVEAPRKAAA